MRAPLRLVSVLLATALPLLADDACKHGFVAAGPIITARSVTSAAYADYDEDGLVDVAFTDGFDLRLALNRGGGVFEPVGRRALESPFSHLKIAAATDVNRDGHPDLLFRGLPGAWARSRGDGTFEPLAQVVFSNESSDGARLLDFDRDGLLDVVELDSDSVRFVRATGDGTFKVTQTVRYTVPPILQQDRTTAGDFDGDGNVDTLRVGNEFFAHRWWAEIVWSALTPSAASHNVILPVLPIDEVQPADLDGDGIDELLGASEEGVFVLRLRNRQLTKETLPFPVQPRWAIREPIVADFDGDGRLDLAFAYGGVEALARGIGDGRFEEPLFLGGPGARFTTADLDGDGVADLVTASGNFGLSVFPGGSSFLNAQPSQRAFPLPFKPDALQLADVNGDGRQDVVATDSGAVSASVLLNDGGGSFHQTFTVQYGSPDWTDLGTRVFIADFDADGKIDLAIEPGRETALVPAVVAFGDGAGQFSQGAVNLAGVRVEGVLRTSAVDPAVLLAVQDDELQALRVSKAGNLTRETLFHQAGTRAVRVFDLDGDSVDEIAVLTLSSSIELWKRVDARWQNVNRLPADANRFEKIVATDIDGDLMSDLLVLAGRRATIYRRNGSEYDAQQVGPRGSIHDIAAADVDGDAVPDLVAITSSNSDGFVEVLRNDGQGAFTPYNVALSGTPYGFQGAVADLDGDGAVDVLVPTYDGMELDRNVCLPPSLRIAPVPSRLSTGESVKLVIDAPLPTRAVGDIIIEQDGRAVATKDLSRSDDRTMVWTSAPLARGRHEFRVEYRELDESSASATITVRVEDVPTRRRAARH